jgi:hypothetical protein
MGDVRWAMGDVRWAMGDGRWAMGDGLLSHAGDTPPTYRLTNIENRPRPG